MSLEEENRTLRERIKELEAEVAAAKASTEPKRSEACQAEEKKESGSPASLLKNSEYADRLVQGHTLTSDEVSRYGRQLILPQLGADGQEKLKAGRVLVVGAGGLGAPVALYLAAAGVGHIGLVDADRVEIDNLHRQVIHSEHTLNQHKAESARDACRRLNSSIEVVAHVNHFDSSNAMEIARGYDILIDATDNVASRYLINDVGILLGVPVVSGSALRLEGQVTIYGYKGGPCYRCIYPKPPPPETVTNCSDGGVVGAVTGVIGSIQALEVLKMLALGPSKTMAGKLLLFDGMACRYMVVKLRPRDVNCAVCGDTPTVKELIDYTQFCGSASNDKTTAPGTDGTDHQENEDERGKAVEGSDSLPLSISAKSYAEQKIEGHVLVDVREPVQFGICGLSSALNVPLTSLKRGKGFDTIKSAAEGVAAKNGCSISDVPVYTLCRRGVFSLEAASLLREKSAETGLPAVQNIRGGLEAWRKIVDPSFPMY